MCVYVLVFGLLAGLWRPTPPLYSVLCPSLHCTICFPIVWFLQHSCPSSPSSSLPHHLSLHDLPQHTLSSQHVTNPSLLPLHNSFYQFPPLSHHLRNLHILLLLCP